MARKRSRKTGPAAKTVVRASISLPAEHHTELERIASAKKVSLAWVVRDAIEQYIAQQWPLLAKPD